MAWKTGKHAEAPPGALCYPAEEAGTVTWFEDDAAEKPADAPAPAAAPASQAARPATKHG